MATKKDIISLVSKIFGLYLFIQTINLFQYLLSTLLYGSGYSGDFWDRFIPFLYLVFSIVVYIGIAVLLIEKSSIVAEYLVRKEEDKPIQLPVNRTTIIETVFILIGSFTVINIIPSLFANIVNWLRLEIKNEYEYNNFNLSDDNLAFSIVKLVIGIVVVLNARALANWIERRGIKASEETI